MTRIMPPLLALAFSLAPVLCWAAEPNSDQAKAIAEIVKRGGTVTVDEKSPGKPVIEVRFVVGNADDTDDTSDAADSALPFLMGMNQLRKLDLDRNAVTDTGLKNLAGMKRLRELHLGGCLQVTDAGLKHLRDLEALEYLSVSSTHVTDAGLEYLPELTKLQFLNLVSTKVTDAGVKKLQQALPKCRIYH